MNRINPSKSELYIANTDGSNERKLLGSQSVYEYHASFSADGRYITFTSERNGDGNSDIWQVRPDGSGLAMLVGSPSVEDSGVLSPDRGKLAYVSTANGYKSNIWVKDLRTGTARNLTNSLVVRGDPSLPDGYFRPAWSPDGQWIVFSSDRNTRWRGHSNGTGWETTQELSIYLIRPDGSDFRLLASKTGYCLGSPKWSPDGKRIVFYEMTVESTWGARGPGLVDRTTSQIVSVNAFTGQDRIQHTNSPGVKIYPQYVAPDVIGFNVKGGDLDGINYTQYKNNIARFGNGMRAPAWSPDGKTVVYERLDYTPRALQTPLYSWQPDWDYRFTDSFPELSPDKKRLSLSTQLTGNSSVLTMNPNGTDIKDIFDPVREGLYTPTQLAQLEAGAVAPAWSPDGKWLAFGLGSYFNARSTYSATIYRTTTNGSSYEQLLPTDDSINCGLPGYSPDGRYIVYRQWSVKTGSHEGLRILDLTTRNIRVLTTEWDNLPKWSPDGSKILFTRRVGSTPDDYQDNYDIFTIDMDGSNLLRLTSNSGNDAHGVWTTDGRILWCSGEYGWAVEAAIYDNTYQPYGHIKIMNADGSNVLTLTDSIWEDGMPQYLPNSVLGH
ncbi:Tol-Pal system TolB-like protein [Cladobotryum mycophilum]|uniref:Tol-Pal system TolB-like protein n=1 Tax=Cladobotryum mycophilum TaxID=491253 RepID=A0ABR0SIZ4_9HYPO